MVEPLARPLLDGPFLDARPRRHALDSARGTTRGSMSRDGYGPVRAPPPVARRARRLPAPPPAPMVSTSVSAGTCESWTTWRASSRSPGRAPSGPGARSPRRRERPEDGAPDELGAEVEQRALGIGVEVRRQRHPLDARGLRGHRIQRRQPVEGRELPVGERAPVSHASRAGARARAPRRAGQGRKGRRGPAGRPPRPG